VCSVPEPQLPSNSLAAHDFASKFEHTTPGRRTIDHPRRVGTFVGSVREGRVSGGLHRRHRRFSIERRNPSVILLCDRRAERRAVSQAACASRPANITVRTQTELPGVTFKNGDTEVFEIPNPSCVGLTTRQEGTFQRRACKREETERAGDREETTSKFQGTPEAGAVLAPRRFRRSDIKQAMSDYYQGRATEPAYMRGSLL